MLSHAMPITAPAAGGLQQPRLFRPDLIPSLRAVEDGRGRQPAFFDVEERLAGLSAKGESLERLSAVVDFEPFRPELERVGLRADRLKGGRPPFDHVLMFKVLVLQMQNNLRARSKANMLICRHF
jgi:hypothetical protein